LSLLLVLHVGRRDRERGREVFHLLPDPPEPTGTEPSGRRKPRHLLQPPPAGERTVQDFLAHLAKRHEFNAHGAPWYAQKASLSISGNPARLPSGGYFVIRGARWAHGNDARDEEPRRGRPR